MKIFQKHLDMFSVYIYNSLINLDVNSIVYDSVRERMRVVEASVAVDENTLRSRMSESSRIVRIVPLQTEAMLVADEAVIAR